MRWGILIARAAAFANVAASAYGYIERRLAEEAATIGPFTIGDHFLEVAYVFLFVLGTFALVGLFWEWLSTRRPVARMISSKSQEFRALYDEIVERRDELNAIAQQDTMPQIPLRYVSKIIELHVVLDGLDIDSPKKIPPPQKEISEEQQETIADWAAYLSYLAARSRVQDLKGARLLMKVPALSKLKDNSTAT